MDEKNKKLEDFFNQSLNQFDDSPSDAVWEGLQQRLDSERTFLEVWTSAIRKYFPYLLLLLGLGVYHFIAQNKINTLTDNLETLQSEQLILGTKLQDCGTRETALLTDLKVQSDELLNSSTKLAVLTENYESHLSRQIKSSNNSPKAFIQNLSIPPTPGQVDIVYDSSTLKALKNKTRENNNAAIVLADKVKKEQDNFKSPRNISLTPTLPFIYSKRTRMLSPPIGPYFSSGIKRGIKIGNQEEDEKLKFRIGYNYRAYHTLTGTGKHFNFGDTHGLRMELIFRNKLALTGGINFNDQQYKVSNAGLPIPVTDLLKYPGGSSFGDQVTEVEVKGHYIGFPLGLKWQIKKFNEQSNLFINPALVWQVYLPQEFDYKINNSSQVDRRNRQIFGYFGSGNIQIGYEKSLRNNLIWQLSLWGEKSFAPLGIEDQSITMLGISTAVLFQK